MSDALINGLAGAGGGIISQLITYPLLTLNTRQQTNRDVKNSKSKVGTLEQMCQVVKEEGWEQLYGGLIPSLVGTAASQGVYYYFYQIFRNRAEEAAITHKKIGISDGSVGMLSSLFIAALSGSLNVLLTNPIWVVVTRMQTQRKKSNKKDLDMGLLIVGGEKNVPLPADKPLPYDTKHVIQEVYEEGGILGFWNGVLPSLIMVCNPSIQFMLYETMLLKMKRRPDGNKKGRNGVTAFEIFLLGALAKLGATVVTYPLLVLKSRLQAKQDKTGDNRHRYTGTWDAIVKMINYEGIYGFYKGMGTKIVQSVLAAAVLFMMKEELVKGVQSLLAKDGSNPVKRKQL